MHHNSGTRTNYLPSHVAFPFHLVFPFIPRALPLSPVFSASRATVKCPYWSLLLEAGSIHVFGAQIFHSPRWTHRSKWLQHQKSGEFLFFFFPQKYFKDWLIHWDQGGQGGSLRAKKPKRMQPEFTNMFLCDHLLFPNTSHCFCRTYSPYALLPTWFLIFDTEKMTVSKVAVLKQFETCHINFFSIWKLSLLSHCILFNLFSKYREPTQKCRWQMIALW